MEIDGKQGAIEKPTNGVLEVLKEEANKGLEEEEEDEDNTNEDDEAESIAILSPSCLSRLSFTLINADKIPLGSIKRSALFAFAFFTLSFH